MVEKMFTFSRHSLHVAMKYFKQICIEMEIWKTLIEGLRATDFLEGLAVLTAILYIVFISFKKTIGWLFGAISSLLYIFICYISQLYIETGLQLFYLIMAFYGWYMWTEDSKDNDSPIIKWSLKNHLVNIFVSTILFLLLGFVFDNYTNQASPYADAFTTSFSLTTTYLITIKVLENWIYWIIVDLVAMYLFWNNALSLTSIMYFSYTIASVYGYFKWRKIVKTQ